MESLKKKVWEKTSHWHEEDEMAEFQLGNRRSDEKPGVLKGREEEEERRGKRKKKRKRKRKMRK